MGLIDVKNAAGRMLVFVSPKAGGEKNQKLYKLRRDHLTRAASHFLLGSFRRRLAWLPSCTELGYVDSPKHSPLIEFTRCLCIILRRRLQKGVNV